MHAGAMLSRRFTLLRPHPYDLPGVERWVARDERRSVDVHVDLLTTSTPGAVRQAAVRVAQVRDLRFTRVLATGREYVNDHRVTYVVTESTTSVPLTTLLNQRVVPGNVAAAIIGEAAHALESAAATGLHHGFLRPEAIHVRDSGRVLVSGLGTDGELASQAGLDAEASQRADARALARLHLALITGKEVDDATVADVPNNLTHRAADLARATISGNAPTTLAAVSQALSPADSRTLRDISHTMGSWQWKPGAEPAPLPPVARLGLDVSLTADTIASAGQLAALALVQVCATPDLAQAVQAGRIASLVPAPQPDLPSKPAQPLRPGYVPASKEEAARFSAHTRRAAARDSHQELGLDTWELIATEQNRTTPPSFVQAVLEFLHRRWPRSVSLSTAAEQARHRARRPAPLRTGPVLVSMFLAVTIVAGIVAIEILTAPLSTGEKEEVDPPSHYPEFTYSPEPLPTQSPEASPDADDEASGEAEGDE